jgi:cobalt/nickel transport system permease protein
MKTGREWVSLGLMAGMSCRVLARFTQAMYIAQGFLPVQWAIFGRAVSLPFFLCETAIAPRFATCD